MSCHYYLILITWLQYVQETSWQSVSYFESEWLRRFVAQVTTEEND